LRNPSERKGNSALPLEGGKREEKGAGRIGNAIKRTLQAGGEKRRKRKERGRGGRYRHGGRKSKNMTVHALTAGGTSNRERGGGGGKRKKRGGKFLLMLTKGGGEGINSL